MYRYSDIARELAANAAMSVPAIKDLRVRKGRTIGFAPDVKAQLVLDQFNFFIASIGTDILDGKIAITPLFQKMHGGVENGPMGFHAARTTRRTCTLP